MLSCPGHIILELCEHTCWVLGVIIGRTHALAPAMLYDGSMSWLYDTEILGCNFVSYI